MTWRIAGRRGDPFGAKLVRAGSIANPRRDEIRQRLLIQLLQLAPAALAEMSAGRLNMVWPPFEAAVRAQQVPRRRAPGEVARCGNAVTLGGDADDWFVSHSALGLERVRAEIAEKKKRRRELVFRGDAALKFKTLRLPQRGKDQAAFGG